jgi:hypothetical protein
MSKTALKGAVGPDVRDSNAMNAINPGKSS